MMEENTGKNLAVDMRMVLLMEIKELEENKKKEKNNENIDIEYFKDCELEIGKNKLKVSIAKISEKMLEENKEEQTLVTYDIYMKYDGQNVLIANINAQGDLQINKDILEKIDPENKLGLLELGEQEKPDLSILDDLEGKTAEELEQELELGEREGKKGKSIADEIEIEDEEEEQEKKKEKEDKEKPRDTRRGLKELNLAVLVLINPRVKECTKAYLDPSTNSLIFKDKFGKEHNPEEYGFKELTTATGNFELSKMQADGSVTNENPSKVYAIAGSNFGISTDFKTHNREANIIVRDRGQGHENSYSIIPGNLTKSDSGIITRYQAKEMTGIREGIYARGEVDEANEKAGEILDNQTSYDRENFKKGFINEREENDRINGLDDLKRAIADILRENPYNEKPENAQEIAGEIVDRGRRYEDIKNEKEQEEKQNKRAEGGRDAGEEAYERRHNRT